MKGALRGRSEGVVPLLATSNGFEPKAAILELPEYDMDHWENCGAMYSNTRSATCRVEILPTAFTRSDRR